MSGFKMDDYVDVAQRIDEFYDRFPEGSLRTGTPPHVMEIGGKPFVVYHAQAWRTPEDGCPADGWAWEPVPGPTQFTRDSELMNAETAAWGRAIVALGFKTKKIASAQEVRARQAGAPAPRPPDGREPKPKSAPATVSHSETKKKPATAAERKELDNVIELAQLKNPERDWNDTVDKFARREFGHGVGRLTGAEVVLTVKHMTDYLAGLPA